MDEEGAMSEKEKWEKMDEEGAIKEKEKNWEKNGWRGSNEWKGEEVRENGRRGSDELKAEVREKWMKSEPQMKWYREKEIGRENWGMEREKVKEI